MLQLICFLHAQEPGICNILEEGFRNVVQGKYKTVRVANSTIPLEIESTDYFFEKLKQHVKQKTLDKAIKVIHHNQINSTVHCFHDSITVSKDITSEARHWYPIAIDTNLDFVQFINRKHSEISKVEDFDKRYKLMDELMLLPEFEKYTSLIEFNTPRFVKFSNAVIIDQYCFLRIYILKNTTDDFFSEMCVFKKDHGMWVLRTTVRY